MRHLCPRAAAPLAASLLLACGERGQVVVLSDTTASGPPRVVLALPTDPSKIHPGAPQVPPGARGDTVRRGLALVDSSERLDQEFQKLRTSLNDQALEMLKMNKHQESYARAFDRWTQRAAHARSLRAQRDKIRKRAAGISARFPRFFRKSRERLLPRAAAASATAKSGGKLVQDTLRKGSTILELTGGDWWITTDSAGFLLLPAQRVTVTGGSVDTVLVAVGAHQGSEMSATARQ